MSGPHGPAPGGGLHRGAAPAEGYALMIIQQQQYYY